MMTEERLSTTPVPGQFLYPDSLPYNPRQDYEFGGVAHQDASQGLLVKVWTAYFEAGWLVIAPMDGSILPERIVFVEKAKYVSLSFDRNMRVTLAWAQGTTVYLYWYDTQANQFVTTTYPGARTPRLAHDDKRELASSYDDVLFFYLRDDKMYMRAQRDRYSVEYPQATVPREKLLRRVGMADNYRLLFEFEE